MRLNLRYSKILVVIGIVLLIVWLVGLTETRLDCAVPSFEFAYPYKTPQTSREFALPDQSWKPLLPETELIKTYLSDFVAVSENELWMDEPLARFDTETKKFTYYDLPDEDNSEVIGGRLFTTGKGDLWFLGTAYGETGDSLFLARFDPKIDSFVRVVDEDKLFLKVPSGSGFDDLEFGNTKGELWIGWGDKLFHYLSESNSAEIVLGPEQGYVLSSPSIEVDLNGGVWVSTESFAPVNSLWDEAENFAFANRNRIVIHYDPKTKLVTRYGRPPGIPSGIFSFFTIKFDHLGRLWADDLGWLEEDEEGVWRWNQVVRSPIFISNTEGPQYQYGWYSPYPQFETENRYLWFPFATGLGVLDLHESEWCLLGSMSVSRITNFGDDVWLVSDGQLYKFEP